MAEPTQVARGSGGAPAAVRLSVLAGGLGLMAVGIMGGLGGTTVALLGRQATTPILVLASLSFLALAVAPGWALSWHAWQSLRQRPSGPLSPRRTWPLVLLFALALLAGAQVAPSAAASGLALAPFHLVAASMPSLIIVALVSRSLKGVMRWRDAVLQVSSGALLSTAIAGLAELVLVTGGMVFAIAVVAALPNGIERLQWLATMLEDPNLADHPEVLAPLVRSPWFVAVALLAVAVVVPLVEEAAKALGVPLRIGLRPQRAQALAWGVASGAGFALTEALFNGLLDLPGWATALLLRAPATTMHSFTGGLMGLAWYELLLRRRALRAAGLYAAGVFLHCVWNTLSVGTLLLSLSSAGVPADSQAWTFADAASAALPALLVLLALGSALGLVLLTRHVRGSLQPARDDLQPPQGTPGPTAGV